jgi:isoleucyl-tRNA synthetase
MTNDPKPESKKHDYSATLNLPEADKKNPDGLDTNESAIPLRANLPQREPKILDNWHKHKLYEKSLEGDKPQGDFIVHVGPPYSNGNIHLGHALTHSLKDMIVKYKSMAGYRSPLIFGWDNHGLPIETAVAKEFRDKKVVPTPVELRKRCREYAMDWVGIQRAEFERCGIVCKWDDPYLTMSADYEGEVIATFGALVAGGYIYRGLKPVHWCPTDRTALADAEIEYADKDDPSIFVSFPLAADPGGVFATAPGSGPIEALAWTSTPWTIPANLALAVHPDGDYTLMERDGKRYLVGRPLIPKVAQELAWDEASITSLPWESKGALLHGVEFKHPLYNRRSPIVTAIYVTFEDGTGIVHTAPGHGRDDFETGQKHDLDVLSPVDDAGRFTSEAGPRFEGQTIWEGNKSVIAALDEVGALAGQLTIRHSYPHCWRCHQPVIFRATRQWFMSIDHNEHRERCLAEIQKVEWFPSESINRISAMVAGRPDWCLSRQRAWGVGIPAFYCRSCESEILEPITIAHVEKLVREHTSDVWFERNATDMLPNGYVCPNCGGSDFAKETDIFDVWFDSGTSNRAVLASGRWPELRWPADVYLEGGDQHRGWFNSSLMLAVATKGGAPYRQVITNGWTLDESGRKFSKSLGNGVMPEEVISKFGADVLRLWIASIDYFEDVRVGKNILDQNIETYRRLRNTLRFGLSNLYDFDPANDAVPYSDLREIDRYALHRLAEVVGEAHRAYERYEFHRVTQAVYQLAGVDLSAFYFDVLKDTLYAEAPKSQKRRSAQTAVHIITEALTLLLAPILSFTCDEVWEKLKVAGNKPFSALLAGFPETSGFLDAALAARWRAVLSFREAAYRAIESARQSKQIGKPLEACVIARVPKEVAAALEPYRHDLADILLVSRVDIEPGTALEVTVEQADGKKCARCWLVKTDVDAETGLCGRCSTVLAEMRD